MVWQVRQIIDRKVFSEGNQRESQSRVVSFQSFLWNKHVDKHGIQDGKLHTLNQYWRSPLMTCITELKMFRLLSEAKIIYKNKG